MRRLLLVHVAVLLLLMIPITGEIAVLALTAASSSSTDTNAQSVMDGLSSVHDSLASLCGYFSHRGKEDNTTDYEFCRQAFHLAELGQFQLPEDMVAAFIRNEQHFYLFADDQQDLLARTGGAQWLELASSRPTTSIGPAQLQLHTLKRLITSTEADGSPAHPQLAHLRLANWRTITEPRNTALLVGAYLRDEALNLRKQGIPVTVATLAYATNPDVMEYNNAAQPVLISPDLVDRTIIRSLGNQCVSVRLPELTNQNWQQVIRLSRHVRNVQEQLAFINISQPSEKAAMHRIAIRK